VRLLDPSRATRTGRSAIGRLRPPLGTLKCRRRMKDRVDECRRIAAQPANNQVHGEIRNARRGQTQHGRGGAGESHRARVGGSPKPLELGVKIGYVLERQLSESDGVRHGHVRPLAANGAHRVRGVSHQNRTRDAVAPSVPPRASNPYEAAGKLSAAHNLRDAVINRSQTLPALLCPVSVLEYRGPHCNQPHAFVGHQR